MNAEVKALEERLQKEFADIKTIRAEVNEKLTEVDGLTTEQLKGINDRMDTLEVKIRAKKSSVAAKAEPEFRTKARFASYLKSPIDDVDAEAIAEAKEDFFWYLRKGEDYREREFKTLRVDTGQEGGFLVEPEFAGEVIKTLLELSPVRSVARVMSSSSSLMRIPVRRSPPSAEWLAEATQDTESESEYGVETIPNGTHRATAATTRELLEDSAFPLEDEIRADFAERFAVNEGKAFVNGDGNEKPQGFMTDSRIPRVASGNASELTYTGLVDVSHDGNINYVNDGRWGLNLSTLGTIRLLEDSAGNLIYQPGIGEITATILGFPYEIFQAMDDVAASAEPVIFGDFRRGYMVLDRTSFSLLRDPYSSKRNAVVEFTAFMRVGGQVVLPDAFRILQIASSV